MTEEMSVEQSQEKETPPAQSPPAADDQPVNNLESITKEVSEMRNNFRDVLSKKDSEIDELKKQLAEQNTLIGNYKEKLFSSNMEPEKTEDPREAIISKAYEDAYKAVYKTLKYRMNGKINKNTFLERCLEAHNEYT